MKQLLNLLLVGILLLCLCGCGAKQPTASQEPASTPEASAEPETVPEASETPEPSPEVQEPEEIAGYEPDFRFSTTDRDGGTYDESIFAGQTLTMINFWEPWCGPCVGEMPDLEKLYQTYRDRGFLILGVYATPGMEDDVDAVLEQTGASYPILHYTEAFDAFETGFVPTTLFVDGEGHVLRHTAEQEILKMLTDYNIEGAEAKAESLYIGSMDYAGWEAIVQEGLQ